MMDNEFFVMSDGGTIWCLMEVRFLLERAVNYRSSCTSGRAHHYVLYERSLYSDYNTALPNVFKDVSSRVSVISALKD